MKIFMFHARIEGHDILALVTGYHSSDARELVEKVGAGDVGTHVLMEEFETLNPGLEKQPPVVLGWGYVNKEDNHD